MIDAYRKEVYFSRYRIKEGVLAREIEDSVASCEKAIEGLNEPCIFIGGGALVYQKTLSGKMGDLAHFVLPHQNTILASTVAFLAINRFKKGDVDDIRGLVPHYIRKSDAEL